MPTTTFVWDPVNDCVISELDGTGSTQAVYTNEPQQYGGVLSQRRGSTSSFLHADATGTTRLLTSTAGATTDTYFLDAWGIPVSSTGSTINPFRWVGRYGYYTDNATGLIYVRAKMYAPAVGRFLVPYALTGSYQVHPLDMPIDLQSYSSPQTAVYLSDSSKGTIVGSYKESHKLTHGNMSVDMLIVNDGWAGLKGRVEFCPQLDTCLTCDSIRLTQTVNLKAWNGRAFESFRWSGANKELNEWRTVDGYHIDVLPACKHSIFYRACTPNKDNSHDGYIHRDGGTQCASLWDEPGWGKSQSRRDHFFMRFETCAVCLNLTYKRIFFDVLGCVHWGFEVRNGKTKGLFPLEWAERMSPTFLKAIEIYEEKHGGK